MSQRIFDMENEQDVKDLFDLLPDEAIKIIKPSYAKFGLLYTSIDSPAGGVLDGINIKWGSHVSMMRPVDKSKWIGKLCWFWDGNPDDYVIDFLQNINENNLCGTYESSGGWYRNCRPLKREEIKFVEDGE